MSHSDTQMIYLASKSPRRQELLNQIGIQFTVLDVPAQDTANSDMVDETVLTNENAADYVNRLSRNKADCAWQFLISRDVAKYPVLTADTTVVLDNLILGKPQDREEACEMMKRLSGKTHQVLTQCSHQKRRVLFTGSSNILCDICRINFRNDRSLYRYQ